MEQENLILKKIKKKRLEEICKKLDKNDCIEMIKEQIKKKIKKKLIFNKKNSGIKLKIKNDFSKLKKITKHLKL